jgi:Uma2 family endonuclease
MSTAFELENRSYTYADYLEWDEDVRAEILNDVVYMMSPPLTIHQRIAGRLYIKIASFLEGKTCEAFIASFRVRLFPKEDKSDDTVVEPDIVVVCDPSKIDERGCNGPPDLVIEILSPSTRMREKLIKYNLYLKAKVKEYWVVTPEEKMVEVYLYDQGGRYSVLTFGVNDANTKENERAPEIIPVSVLAGLEIDTKDIFQDK